MIAAGKKLIDLLLKGFEYLLPIMAADGLQHPLSGRQTSTPGDIRMIAVTGIRHTYWPIFLLVLFSC
jgi:hypothetical protein